MRRAKRATVVLAGLAAFLLCVVFIASASEQGEQSTRQQAVPKISFQEIEHDFGKVGPDQTVKHAFTFRNAGGGLLVLGDIKTTCGCTGTLLSQREIAPGGEGTLEVSFHSGRSGGQRRKAIFVNSNDPDKPSVKLEIIANVIVPVEVRPRALYWVTERNEQSIRTIDLLYSPDLRMNITSLEVSSPAFSASYAPASQNDIPSYQITVKYDGSLPIGNFQEKLNIATDNAEYPKYDVILRGKVVGPVKVVPDSVALGVVNADQLPSRIIRVSNASKKDFAVTAVECSSPLIAVELSRQESARYEIKVMLTQAPPTGAFSEKLSIKTNDSADPVVVVPVYAYVK
jgi:hypothetical protein